MIYARLARQWIALPWLGLFALVVLGLSWNTFTGGLCNGDTLFCPKAESLWTFFMSATLPTAGLIVSALAADAMSSTRAEQVGKPYFILTLGLSILYLVIVLLIVYAVILGMTETTDIGLAQRVIVAPLQGLVSGALGVFYLSARAAPET